MAATAASPASIAVEASSAGKTRGEGGGGGGKQSSPGPSSFLFQQHGMTSEATEDAGLAKRGAASKK